MFYVTNPSDPKWSIVLAGKRRILGIGDVTDENDYDAYDDTPPFTVSKPVVENDIDNDAIHIRSDHNEGILE